MLVWHGIGVINTGDFLNSGEKLLESLLRVTHDDDTFARVATWSPEEVALMPADGWWQTVFRAEKIDSSGLPIILNEDRGFGAHIRREVVIDASDVAAISSQPNWSANNCGKGPSLCVSIAGGARCSAFVYRM